MIDSTALPLADGVHQDLVTLRKKGVNQLGRINLPALQKCAVRAGHPPSQVSPSDIEALIRAGTERLEVEGERNAIKCLLGLTSDLRRTSLTVRRDRAAREIHLSAEGFRRHTEPILIRKLSSAIIEECRERISESGEQRLNERQPELEGTHHRKEKESSAKEDAWRSFYRRMEGAAKKFNNSELLKMFSLLGGAIIGVTVLVVTQCQAPEKAVQSSAPAVSPQPFPGGPPPSRSVTNEIYIAGNRFLDQEFRNEDEAYCGKSPASNRADAYLCVVPPQLGPTRAKLDPCFGVDNASVVCGEFTEPQKFSRFHARGVQAAESNPVPPGTRTWPFQVILDDGTICRSLTGVAISEGDSYFMGLRNQPLLQYEPGYYCGTQFGPTLATEWNIGTDGLLDGVRWLEIPDSEKAQLSGLRIEGDSWFGMYSPQLGTPYKRTHIAMVIF
ncbi:hypothetical protein AB0G00_10000 [Nocardia salmonicida]|uniref:hypothetical protein n=1 Tax=Nocardia salmonicida TaxID=53431 RepID=UPI0033E16997